MKIKKQFTPVSIILETEDELNIFKNLLLKYEPLEKSALRAPFCFGSSNNSEESKLAEAIYKGIR